jgi:hypothetical protein
MPEASLPITERSRRLAREDIGSEAQNMSVRVRDLALARPPRIVRRRMPEASAPLLELAVQRIHIAHADP